VLAIRKPTRFSGKEEILSDIQKSGELLQSHFVPLGSALRGQMIF